MCCWRSKLYTFFVSISVLFCKIICLLTNYLPQSGLSSSNPEGQFMCPSQYNAGLIQASSSGHLKNKKEQELTIDRLIIF